MFGRLKYLMCAKMFGPVFTLTILLSLTYCYADGSGSNITDANLNAMALASSPIIVNSDPICPIDSEIIDGVCNCNQELCAAPPCDKYLNFVRNGTNTPGDCCSVYSCDNCTGDILINGTCTCPEDTSLNNRGNCECNDPHKSLQNETCICDENKCELPLLCDKHSVPIKVKEDCCYKTNCKPCPEDSFGLDYNSEEIESKCVCYPCPETQCNETHVPVILRRGRYIPQECCDIYECLPKPLKECKVANTHYANGEWWITDNQQNCSCSDGVRLCNEPIISHVKRCYYNNSFYDHLKTWIEDDCTNCTCDNGSVKCIAHLCNVTYSEVKKYKDCIDGEYTHAHLESWLKYECVNCTCHDGTAQCKTDTCNGTMTRNDCPPFENCKKICRIGYKVNKKGCKICKCKLSEYNLDKYPLVDAYIKDNNLTEEEALTLLRFKTSSRRDEEQVTESIIPDCHHKDFLLIIVLAIVAFFAGILVCFALMKYCKRKCTYNYSPVLKPTDNNNLPAQENIKYISEKSPLKT